HLSSNISKIAIFKKGIDKKLILTIGIPSVLFVILGAYLSKFADNKMLEAGNSFTITSSAIVLEQLISRVLFNKAETAGEQQKN
ncbi:MAG: hypothetical protein K2Q15_13185, partial [Burkholderiales bacterium]|nr:hypothetical protein [Burkholderiales bacterium]